MMSWRKRINLGTSITGMALRVLGRACTRGRTRDVRPETVQSTSSRGHRRSMCAMRAKLAVGAVLNLHGAGAAAELGALRQFGAAR